MSVKSLLLIFVCLSMQFTFAQSTDAVTKAFWNDNMLAIARLDAQKIVDQTNFPLAGKWSSVHGLKNSGSKAEYSAKLSEIFPTEMRTKMKTQDHRQLAAVKMDGEVAYITYTYSEITIKDGKKTESKTFYSFEKFGGKWKLASISYVG